MILQDGLDKFGAYGMAEFRERGGRGSGGVYGRVLDWRQGRGGGRVEENLLQASETKQ